MTGFQSYTPHLSHLKLCALHCTLLSILFKHFAFSCRWLLNIRLWFFFFPVAFIVIGVGVYGSKIKDLHHKLGWSFGVTIGSAVLGFVAGIAELIVLLKWEMASFILLEVLNNVCRSLCIWHFRFFFVFCFWRKWEMFGWSMALVSTQNHQCLFHLLTFAFVFIFQEYFGTLCTNKLNG